jgi:hypothetical protein
MSRLTLAIMVTTMLSAGCTSTLEREGETLTTVCAIFCITHKREGKASVKQQAECPFKGRE